MFRRRESADRDGHIGTEIPRFSDFGHGIVPLLKTQTFLRSRFWPPIRTVQAPPPTRYGFRYPSRCGTVGVPVAVLGSSPL